MTDSPSRALFKAAALSFRCTSSKSPLALILLQLFCMIASPQILSKSRGNYDSLSARQKKLVSDYAAYLHQKSGFGADPKQMYDQLPQSYRTTYEAVTNALEKTLLTSKSGARMGSALDLVSIVEGIAGEIPGKRDDEQFRVSAALRPGALAVLNRSTQFRRNHDNTLYHVGYPLNYRTNGFPAIHLSLNPDGTQADIDIDYRPSSFPQALLESQFSTAASDIRAGDNYLRHTTRWTGLDPWWQNLVEPGVEQAGVPEQAQESAIAFPAEPPDSAKDLSDAVGQFLNTWLVLQKPEAAVAYFGDEALSCTGSPPNSSPLVRRMHLYRQLQLINQTIGKIDSPSQAVLVPPSPEDSSSSAAYVGFHVPDNEVPALLCAPSPKENLKDVYLVSFRLRIFQSGEVAVHQYWHQTGQTWKIIALHVDRNVDSIVPPVAEIPALDASGEPRSALGDPEMITSALQFFQNWLSFHNIRGAVAFLAPSAYQCFGHGKATTAAAQANMQAAFEEVSQAVTSGGSLDKYMQALPPWDPQQAIVEHLQSAAFAIVQPTAGMLDSVRCTPSVRRGPAYITSFVFGGEAAKAAALLAVWEPVDDEWMITSLSVLDP
jgi:hypothetical protein